MEEHQCNPKWCVGASSAATNTLTNTQTHLVEHARPDPVATRARLVQGVVAGGVRIEEQRILPRLALRQRRSRVAVARVVVAHLQPIELGQLHPRLWPVRQNLLGASVQWR